MKTFKQFINELKIYKLYTIAPADLQPGEDLKSMNTMHGRKKGEKLFMKKWEDSVSAREIVDHPKHVWFWKPIVHEPKKLAKIGLGLMPSEVRQGLALYDVRPGRHMASVEDEFPFAKVKGNVPGRYVRNVWDDQTQSWKPFYRKFKKGK